MEVKQIYEIVNSIASEQLGESAVLSEDLTNIVEIGQAFANVAGLDNFVRAVNDKVGRMVFVNRYYKGRVPSVLHDGWEFGSILEKIAMELPESAENEEWNLQNGHTYSNEVFYASTVTAKCWNDRITFSIDISITEKQVKSAFNSAAQMNTFLSMIYTAIENRMTLDVDGLIMRAINSLIADTIYDDYAGASLSGSSKTKAVNLLYRYNNEVNEGDAISASDALTDPDFIRFAAYVMSNYASRMSVYSTLFNVDGKQRFTPADKLHVVLLDEFANAAKVYLYSDTFNKELVKLPAAETVPFWQGSGTDYAFSSTSKIYVTSAGNHSVQTTGILGVMFDDDAIAVCCEQPEVRTAYNAKGNFWNEYHTYTGAVLQASDENAVVFFVA